MCRCDIAVCQVQLIGRKVQDDGKGVVFPDRKLYKRVRRTGRLWTHLGIVLISLCIAVDAACQERRGMLKVTLQQIDKGNEEVIIRYRQMTEHLAGIVEYLEGKSEKLSGTKDGQQFFVSIQDILYLESVDGITYFYTKGEVYRTGHTLALFETLYAQDGFFRCSKSVMLNIYRIRRLKSMSGNRIDATMDNDEHIVISRRYARELRNILKEEM